MKRSFVAAFGALAMLSGCAGTRMSKLAKCTGPYRYANAYGTVLPSLPIPGQPAPVVSSAAPPAAPTAVIPSASPGAAPAGVRPPYAPAAPPAADAAPPAKSSGLMPFYASC